MRKVWFMKLAPLALVSSLFVGTLVQADPVLIPSLNASCVANLIFADNPLNQDVSASDLIKEIQTEFDKHFAGVLSAVEQKKLTQLPGKISTEVEARLNVRDWEWKDPRKRVRAYRDVEAAIDLSTWVGYAELDQIKSQLQVLSEDASGEGITTVAYQLKGKGEILHYLNQLELSQTHYSDNSLNDYASRARLTNFVGLYLTGVGALGLIDAATSVMVHENNPKAYLMIGLPTLALIPPTAAFMLKGGYYVHGLFSKFGKIAFENRYGYRARAESAVREKIRRILNEPLAEKKTMAHFGSRAHYVLGILQLTLKHLEARGASQSLISHLKALEDVYRDRPNIEILYDHVFSWSADGQPILTVFARTGVELNLFARAHPRSI